MAFEAGRARRVLTRSAEETLRLGRKLAQTLQPGACLALIGELGAGKTTFVQGLARGLGVTEPVTSPSYLIVQEYSGKMPLFHVDAYRLGGAEALREIGFEEYLSAGGVVAVEWANRVREALPLDCFRITFRVRGPELREVVFYPRAS